MTSKSIALGDKDYPIAPLGLGAMRQVGPCFTRIGIDTPEAMGAQITIIFQGMKAADPTVTAEMVDGLVGVTFKQIRQAVQQIGDLCGLEVKEVVTDVGAGEAEPAPRPA